MAVPLLGGVRIDQERLDAFVSESVALSSDVVQVVRVSSEITFEMGPAPCEIKGASCMGEEEKIEIIIFPCPWFTPAVFS